MSVLRIALIGNPNCGKTTLFNTLTGAHQKVGNWPGVTVERKVGQFRAADGGTVDVIDLPGVYSLEQDEFGIDEKIAIDFLKDREADVVINILDATSLDRQLLLTHQLKEYGIPMVIAVNMMDVADKNGIKVDLEQLSQLLGMPVVGIVASEKSAADVVKTVMTDAGAYHPVPGVEMPQANAERIAFRLAEVRQWFERSVSHVAIQSSLTDRLDRVLLNRWLGLPFFLLVMYLLFTFAVNVGAVFIDFFDILLGAWLVDGVHQALTFFHAPAWLQVLLADGLGGGIQLVGTFIPVIGFLYLGLSLLEGSGYIVRAAFVVDRVMQGIGLPGKAFVPLIVGFGCNVPSIMAARTLDRESDRLITVAMAPFMSCGARLTVYALFAATFFGRGGQNIVFLLYLLGIVMAVLTGWFFRKSMFQEQLSSSIMEMPKYHLPSWRNILMTTWHRLRSFVLRAGKTIVGVVIILSFLNSWGADGSFGNEDSQNSMLSVISRAATPLLSPMGVQEENWPATVGIVTGIFAKEAVVGTLDALYSDVAGLNDDDQVSVSLWQSTMMAVNSIWTNTLTLTDTFTDPLGIRVGQYDSLESASEDQDVNIGTLLAMTQLFVTPFAAFCYLVFILLYTPCVASMGALVREAGGHWAWLVIGWTTTIAYATATLIYQAGTWLAHPLSSTAWIICMLAIVAAFLISLSRASRSGWLKAQSRLIPIKDIS
ncbi:MAG: ferrous iron transport protein B [Reinekea sp.]